MKKFVLVVVSIFITTSSVYAAQWIKNPYFTA